MNQYEGSNNRGGTIFWGGFPQVVTSESTRWLFTVGKVRESEGKRPANFHYGVMKLLRIVQRGQLDYSDYLLYTI